MEFEFHPAAEAEFDEAVTHYKNINVSLGLRFCNAVDVAVQEIIENPRRFPLISRRARRAKARRFPYGLVYVVEAGMISIKAVMHLHRQPGYWKYRLR